MEPISYDKVENRKLGDIVVVRRTDDEGMHGYYGKVVGFDSGSGGTARIRIIGHENGKDHLDQISRNQTMSYMLWKYDLLNLEDYPNRGYYLLSKVEDDTLVLPDMSI